MKLISMFFLFFISFLEGNSQIAKVKLKDSAICGIVDFYMDSLKIPKDQYGVFLIELRVEDSLLRPIETTSNYERLQIKNSNIPTASYSLRIVFTSMVHGIEINPPDFYSVHRNKPVLFYSGMNFLIIHSREEIENLLKSVEKYLPLRKTYNYEPNSMEFFVTDSKFTLVRDE